MKKEEVLKEIEVLVKSEIYLGNRIRRPGAKLKIKRYQFSPYSMFSLDENGEVSKEQLTKLDTEEVKKALGKSVSTAASVSYPIIGEEEAAKKEAAKNKAIADAAAAQAAKDAEAASQGAGQSALGGGAASLV